MKQSTGNRPIYCPQTTPAPLTDTNVPSNEFNIEWIVTFTCATGISGGGTKPRAKDEPFGCGKDPDVRVVSVGVSPHCWMMQGFPQHTY